MRWSLVASCSASRRAAARGPGGVAGGVDVVEAAHATMAVDRNEPALVMRQAGQARTLQLRQRYHPIDVHFAAAGQDEDTVAHQRGARGGAQADASGLEHRLDRPRRGWAKQLKRLLLGCHEPHRGLRASVAKMPGGQQRELIDRQRPDSLRGQRQRHRPCRPGDEVIQQVPQGRHVGAAAEGERARQRLTGERPRSDDQDVIRDPLTLTRDGHLVVRLDTRQGVPDEAATAPVGEDLD
jgi:hypothetical protein